MTEELKKTVDALKIFSERMISIRAELRNISMKEDQRYAIYGALEGMEELFLEALKNNKQSK